MPEPGMGSGGARGGAGMGGGGRSDRDEPGLGTLLSGESVGSVLGSDPRAEGKVGGYYSHERGRWIGGTSPIKTSPEESFSAIPAVAPVTKPDTTKTTFYLDETPALQTQIDTSAANKAAAAAAERTKTMGSTMGGGPSYDPLRPDPSTPAWAEPWDQESEMSAASSPLTFTNVLRTEQGYKEPVWKPEFSQWSPARKADWMAGFDKTLGAKSQYDEMMQRLRSEAVSKSVQDMMTKHIDRWYADHEIHGPEYNSVRDVIRHGIATNQFGLTKMTGYETFKSGQEWSDYKNNYAAHKFAQTLKPGQNFDDEWAAAVIQEKMNPGSTGITIDFKAGTENDPTASEALQGWMRSFMDRLAGMQGGGGMITQAEQGGG